ncbi:MAG: hypothetical protein L0Z50_35300 [Verrucomicrobiales bacterium]|nr:hypothetical protein [Verrucomicrobiales bacterium]
MLADRKLNAVSVNRHLIFPNRSGGGFVPPGWASVRHDGDIGGIEKHSQGIFHCLIVRSVNGNPLSPDANAIAVLAEKHAVSQAGVHAVDIGWNVKNAGGEQQKLPLIGPLSATDFEHLIPLLAFKISSVTNCTP